MPTTLDLINSEKIAATIFIIASFQALGSAFEAERAELEKQQGATAQPSSSTTATVNSSQLALDSTLTGTLGFLIYLIVAIVRKSQLEEEIKAGTSKVSIIPNIFIISGFIVSIIGNIMRVPAIKQRLEEAQEPVIL